MVPITHTVLGVRGAEAPWGLDAARRGETRARHLPGLRFPASELLEQFLVFAGQVIIGLVIMLVGLYLANLAAKAIVASNAEQSDVLAVVSRMAILVLAGAMALRHLGLADSIIDLTFGLLLGAMAALYYIFR